MVLVVWVHGFDLLARWCAKYFDDLNQLVNPTLSREQRLTQHQLRHHTPGRPNVCQNNTSVETSESPTRVPTNVSCVVSGSKYELRRAIISGAYVAHVRLACNENLGTTKIAQFEHPSSRIEQKVLRLDIAVTDANRMDVRE